LLRRLVVELLCLGPAALAAQTPRRPDPLVDSLRSFAITIADLLRARDVKGSLALYGDTANFVHVENGTVIPWPTLSRMMREFFATATSNPVSVRGTPGVRILDRNTAVVYVTHHADSADGRPAHDGVWTGVLRREPRGWRIVHSHSSDKKP
jgi:ketosteroid isomerase-like protein